MVRMLIAGGVGAVVLFVWGFLFWGALMPMGEAQMRSLPGAGEEALAGALKTHVPQRGVYFIPGLPEDSEEAMGEWERRHEAGPLAMLVVTPQGARPMAPLVFIKGFGIALAMGLLASFLVSGAARGGAGFVSRFLLVVYLGVFAGVATHGVNWAWFYFPDDHTAARIVDTVVGSALMGLAIAAVVRPKRD